MRVFRVIAFALAAGCSSSTGPVNIGGVVADARSGAIFIENQTPLPVYTFVIGRNAAAFTDWVACTNPSTCAGLPPGQSKTAPFPQPVNGQKETEALVYWWHLVPNLGGTFKPDSIRVGVVPLN